MDRKLLKQYNSPYYIVIGTDYAIPKRISTMSEGDKDYLRNYMKDVPRGSKGRWI